LFRIRSYRFSFLIGLGYFEKQVRLDGKYVMLSLSKHLERSPQAILRRRNAVVGNCFRPFGRPRRSRPPLGGDMTFCQSVAASKRDDRILFAPFSDSP